ncbi:MAG TPA: hypothetical protein VLB87_03355 [Pyrinomonadaceae bacterium]|nr:hypothetical protein [Pyrinomonadaceae bacterium]
MNNINFGRVILGGLVAGLILNIGEYLLNEVVFAQQMRDFFERLRITPPGGTFIAIAVAITFLLGIVIVCLYAMIRPRYGPGPKTAIIAAIVAWFCVYFYCGILNTALFNLPATYVLMGMVWGIVEYGVAAIAGAWLYKE